MSDMESYLQSCSNSEELYSLMRGKPIEMSDTSLLDDDWLIMHPTRDDEVVGQRTGVWTFEFTPAFVQECFEASKSGRNLLVDTMNNHIPQI